MRNFRQIASQSLSSHPVIVPLGAFLSYFVLLLTLGNLLIALVVFVTGHDLLSASEALRANAGFDSAASWSFRMIQGVNQFVGYGLSALLLGWLLGRPKEELSLQNAPGPSFLFLAMMAIVASIPIVQILMILPEYLQGMGWEGKFVENLIRQEDTTHILLSEIFVGAEKEALLGNLLVFAVLPAFCEEAFFRGLIQRQLARHLSPHLAIWLAAAIFSFIHFQFLGFFSRWALGAMLGYFLYYSGSLWPGILAHFCFNAVSVVGASMYPELAKPDYQFSWEPLLLSIILTGGLLSLYVRQGKIRLSQMQTPR